MLAPEKAHPDIYSRFNDGYFCVPKSKNPFSLIGTDQNHEQRSRNLEDNGGAINLDEECFVTEHTVAGPERARIVGEFEASISNPVTETFKHHDASKTIPKNYTVNAKALVDEFDRLGNSFKDDSNELVILHTKEVMPKEVGQAVMQAEKRGIEQYNKFAEERLKKSTFPISHPISSNKIPLPGNAPKTRKNKEIATIKDDVHLLGKLYIALQVREGNADKLFQHENTDIPHSLSKNGI